MERIKNILQRLQELYYSKHQKTAIDVDLMLDYSRVMYADLLEWRKEFKDLLTEEKAEKNTAVVTSEAEKETSAPDVPETPKETAASQDIQQAPIEPVQDSPEASAEVKATPVDEENVHPEPEETTKAAAVPETTESVIYQPIQRDGPLPREPVREEEPVIAKHPEAQSVNTLMTDNTGISFEPPAAPETRDEVQEELLVTAPSVNQPIEEIPAPQPAAIPLPEIPAPAPRKAEAPQAQLFQAAKAANKDIRSSIGINDKYLFLNELFNNHKSNYEETLDQLNHFSTAAQAQDWMITKVAPVQKWDKDDATVQSFYAMLDKHFADR